MMTARDYWFRCRVERIIDGDTFTATLSAGLNLYSVQHIRLLDVDTPELRGSSAEEHARAVAAKDYTVQWVAERSAENPSHADFPLWIRTEKADSFGRWLGRIESSDGRCLNSDLLLAGHAVAFKSTRGAW